MQHNNGVWSVNFVNNTNSMFNSTEGIAAPESFKQSQEYNSLMRGNTSRSLKKGWNVFEVPLTFDSSQAGDLSLYISSISETTLSVQIGLNFLANAKGSIISYNSTAKNRDLKESILQLTGNAAKDLANDFVSNAGITDDILATIISGGIQQSMNYNINYSLDKFLGQKEKTSQTLQTLKFSMDGKGSLSGSIQAKLSTGGIDVKFPIGENKTGLKLGAWNLKNVPVIYMHPVGVIYRLPTGLISDENEYIFRSSGNYNAEVIFNPQLLPHIKSYRITYTPVYMLPDSLKNELLPTYPNDISSLPSLSSINKQYPQISVHTVFDSSDFLCYKNGICAENSDSKNNKIKIFANEAKGVATYWNLWGKYGKPQENSFDYNSSIYKFIYAPGENDLIRGGAFKFGGQRYYLKVSLYAEVEFEGKTSQILETRTYKPIFFMGSGTCNPIRKHTYRQIAAMRCT